MSSIYFSLVLLNIKVVTWIIFMSVMLLVWCVEDLAALNLHPKGTREHIKLGGKRLGKMDMVYKDMMAMPWWGGGTGLQ